MKAACGIAGLIHTISFYADMTWSDVSTYSTDEPNRLCIAHHAPFHPLSVAAVELSLIRLGKN